MAGAVLTSVADATFAEKVLGRAGLALVEFSGEHCAPCVLLEKILVQLAAELPALAIFVLDADTSPDTAVTYGVRGVPTLVFLKDGVEVERLVGMQRKDKLIAAAKRHGL